MIRSRLDFDPTVHIRPHAGKTLAGLAVGVAVEVRSANPALNKQTGVVVDAMPTVDHDCIVQLDKIDKVLGFYWQEIVLL